MMIILSISITDCAYSSNHKSIDKSIVSEEGKAYIFTIAVSSSIDNKAKLNSARNDVDTLLSFFENSKTDWEITSLNDSYADYSNVTATLDNFEKNIEKGSILIIYFSGYGEYIDDINGDESDGHDETLHLYDRKISDDDISYYLDKISRKMGPEGEIVLIVDACFSGTMEKGISPGLSRGFSSIKPEDSSMYDEGKTSNIDNELATIYSISASKPGHYAYETSYPLLFRDKSSYFGVFTISLCELFNKIENRAVDFNIFVNHLSRIMEQINISSTPYSHVSRDINYSKWIEKI